MAFNLLAGVFGDEAVAEIFSADETIRRWLEVEAALAQAQGDVGLIAPADAAAITSACGELRVDRERLWKETRNVGYPILPLVRMISAALPEGPNGRVHLGATTQDIMDSALALQVRAAGARLETLLDGFGDAVALLVERHAATVMPARTHGQQAVPTTFGAKMAVFLSELTRHRSRLRASVAACACVSLYGAGGTSAAIGERAPAVRARLAELLGLRDDPVPWHVARDNLAHFGLVCAAVAATCVRFAREIADLARTELAEVGGAPGHHRGASSTMPQKANPIECETAIGFGVLATTHAAAFLRAMEAGHERAAGEWQVEWQAVPGVCEAVAGALGAVAMAATGLHVHDEAMRANLRHDHGAIMAEAHMMRLAPELGRETAHDVVYDAVLRAREDDVDLPAAVAGRTGRPVDPVRPEEYLGTVGVSCDAALAAWRRPPA